MSASSWGSYSKFVIVFVMGLALLACGSSSDSGNGDDDDDDGDGDGGDLTLTSSADDDGFEPGGTIPDRYACEDMTGGENRIPKISWSGVPEATQSFALTIIDLTDDAPAGTMHGLLVNLGPTTTSLSNNSVVTADQVVIRYLGPCPVGHTDTHTYEATLYALDVAETTVTTDDLNDIPAVIADIEAAAIASDSIRGTFTAD